VTISQNHVQRPSYHGTLTAIPGCVWQPSSPWNPITLRGEIVIDSSSSLARCSKTLAFCVLVTPLGQADANAAARDVRRTDR
jgi:hypothetical protein